VLPAGASAARLWVDACSTGLVLPAVRAIGRVLGVLAGAAAVVVSFPPLGRAPLVLIALVPLWGAVRNAPARRAFLLGLAMGTATYAGGFYWVSTTLRDFAFMSWPLTFGLLALFCLYGGCAWGLWALGSRCLMRAGVPALLAAPALFVSIEHAWPMLFPWHLGGGLGGWNTVAQIADLGGMSGLSLVCVLVNVGLVETWVRLRARMPSRAALRPFVLAVLVLGLAGGYGSWRARHIDRLMAAAPRLRIGVVQGNIGIYDKERAHLAAGNTRRFLTLSEPLATRGAELIVWPETAIQQPTSVEHPRAPASVHLSVPLLTGGLAYSEVGPRRKLFNVAYLVEGGAVRGLTPKNRLLLFGEHLPFEQRFPRLRRIFPNAGALDAGTWSRVPETGRVRLGVLICYEDVIPSYVRATAALTPSPNLLVNLTNDSWFGRSTEPFQHATLASFRAIELRRGLVRATNTGLSCLIDARGRIVRHGGLCAAETSEGHPEPHGHARRPAVDSARSRTPLIATPRVGIVMRSARLGALALLALTACVPTRLVRFEAREIRALAVQRVTDDAIDVTLTAVVANPNPLAARVHRLRYRIYVAERLLGHGERGDTFEVAAHGEAVIDLPIHVRFADIPPELPRLAGGEVTPYRAEVSIDVASRLGEHHFELNRRGIVRTLNTMRLIIAGDFATRLVALRGVRLAPALDGVTAFADLEVRNRLPFPLEIRRVEYAVTMRDVLLGEGRHEHLIAVPSHGTARVTMALKVPFSAAVDLARAVSSAGRGVRVRGRATIRPIAGITEIPFDVRPAPD
jgi:apolipoprotein N-acyltransferase